MECVIAAVEAAPAAFRAHLKPLEEYAASALVERSSSISTRKSASHLLSLLPSITGTRSRPHSEVSPHLIIHEIIGWRSNMQAIMRWD